MPRGIHSYDDYIRKIEQKKRKRPSVSDEILAWRKKWMELGPAKFAEEILACPPDVPEHPELKVVPEFVVLTQDQEDFLITLWKRDEDQIILAAGRGAGKTFCIGIYVTWRLCCFEFFTITVMGGSAEQSKKIKEYVDFWRLKNDNVIYCIYKSNAGGGNQVAMEHNRWGSYARFPACSETSARGPHVTQVIIDEVCLHPDDELYIEHGITSKVTDLNIGNPILSHDGGLHTITNKFKRIINEEIMEIKPYYYSIGLKLTKNHPILACKRDSKKYWFDKENRWIERSRTKTEDKITLSWIPAGELSVNDFVAFPIPKIREDYNPSIIDISSYLYKTTWNNLTTIKTSNDFYELIGWYIAEGSTNKDRVFFSLNRGEEDRVSELIATVFGKRAQKHYFKNNNCVNVFFSSRSMVRWLKIMCGHGAKNKHIPYDFMNLPFKYKEKILEGLLRGDASENDHNYRLHISSYDLGMQFAYIMASRGQFVGIQKEQSGYGFTLHKKNRFGFKKDGYLIIPIREINTLHYSGPVYNFSIDETETYCSPFTILHNCVGEAKSTGGTKAVRAARGQVMSSAQSLLVYTSTAQFIFGTFFRTWRDAEKLGFKRFRWSTGRYYRDDLWFREGTKEPNWDLIDTVLVKDREAKHWISNVWWITDEDIRNYRKNATDDEFLVESLGGISRGSGLVFSRDDLRACICTGEEYTDDHEECEECNPYNREKCPMMKKNNLVTSGISSRKMGVDFGDVAPNAVTVVGIRDKKIYVLYSDERTGLRTDEMLDWVVEIATIWSIFEIFADPEERAMRESLQSKGYSVPHLWAYGGGAKKQYYVVKFKRSIEKHRLFIPKKFQFLVTSLSELAYDEQGDIRKHNDHSFDSDIYAVSDYDIEDPDEEFWKITGKTIRLWG